MYMANPKLLVEDPDQEYEISQEDIDIYAKQIGIDLKKEPHLTWIAKEGLSAKVPEPWLICVDEKDRIFYYNPETSKTSWDHPLDKHYASLVIEERSKSKSLNSASSDYGFESKLSSLADAPPLSSSGKNSPLPFKSGRKDGNLSVKKFEFGHIENRRGTQLAPVRLNTLKMPTASITKSSSGMSFMPKGSSFTKNIKRVKDEKYSSNQHEEGFDEEHTPLDDSNESINSDDGSKYSYEETDDEKQIRLHESFDMLDASQLSPMHSADESPDALDINSLVQLQAKVPPRLDSSLQKENRETIYNKENSPSLSLRKVGQPTFLKPLTTTKKKSANKSSKTSKKVKSKNLIEADISLDDKIPVISDEQQIMLEQIQKEWLSMQDDIEKHEKEKYEEILIKSTKNLEEEEMKLRKENSEKIEKIKSDLQKKIEEEEQAAEINLQSFKTLKKQKIAEEEEKLQKELEILSESFKTEIKKMEEKNSLELIQRKKELEESSTKELENLKKLLECNKRKIEEAHEAEISNLQEVYEKQIKEIKSEHEEKKCEITSSLSQKESALEEVEKLQNLIKEETKKYEDLLTEKQNILKEISSEKSSLEELKNEAAKSQSIIEEFQDEIEKTENDLDLLRSEKSGLISELNLIKENISNQKANLSNLEKKKAPLNNSNSSKKLSEISINTDLSFNDFISKAVQVSVSCSDISSQVDNISYVMLDAMCQTSVIHVTASKSCQTVAVPSVYSENIEKISNDKKNSENGTLLDKNIENVLNGFSTKLDSRISSIENQLRLLQENLSNPITQQSTESSQEFRQNQHSKSKIAPITENKTFPPTYFTSHSVGQFSNDVHLTNQNKCKCEIGDPESCSVLQDVKNSVYRLNDILCTSFVTPLRNSSVFQANQLVNNYSSPFENFYAQLRQMQEKQRHIDLKHKCEDITIQFAKDSSSDFKDTKNSERFNDRKSSYELSPSDKYSHNLSEDPLIRARNIVLREKAKAWKEQQTLQSSVSPMFSVNSPPALQSSNTDFILPYTVPSSEQTFVNFEMDPETDFNMWMTRLNALQLRIRSHKIL